MNVFITLVTLILLPLERDHFKIDNSYRKNPTAALIFDECKFEI